MSSRPKDLSIHEALAYLWDMKARNIERIENEARPRFAKIFDKVIGQRRHKKGGIFLGKGV